MRSDDIAPLLRPAERPDLGFRQGVVVSWNPATGENVINVAGQPFSDLQMINLADSPNIRVGDVVAIRRYRSTYLIEGRIVSPGTQDFGSASTAFGHGTDKDSGFAVTVGGAESVQTSVDVPPWANSAQVQVFVNASIFNGDTTDAFVYVRAGAGNPGALVYGDEAFTEVEAGSARNVVASTQRVIGGLGSTLDFAGHIRSSTALGTQPSNLLVLDANITFTRTR